MQRSSNAASTQYCRSCHSSATTGSTMVGKFKSLPAAKLEPRSGMQEGAEWEPLGMMAMSVDTKDPKWLSDLPRTLQWQNSP